jgi:simple sugar transport system substrate-binding protein
MKTLVLTVVSTLSIVVLGSTSPAHAEDSCKDRERQSIYFATHAFPHPFFGTMEAGARQGAADACLDITWTQDVTFAVATTIERMETAITQKPDLLVITATEPVAMLPTVERAAKAGIPVIAINAPDPAPRSERLPYLVYIGGDEYEGGVEAASQVLKSRTPEKAVCLNAFPGHVGLEQRCRGWADTLAKADVTSEVLDISGGATEAEQALSGFLIRNPDVDAFFATSPGIDNYGVAIQLLKSQGKIGNVSLVVFDMSEEILQSIKAGETLAAIDQQPYLQGYLASILARQYLEAGLMPGRDILTGPGVVNADNVDVVIAGAKSGRR